MTSRIVAIRADDTEIAAWKASAARQGLSFNRWAKQALKEQLELHEALLREREAEGARVDDHRL